MATRTIIITGASDGIGAAAARRLRGPDVELVLVGRSPSKTAAIAREVGAASHVADFSSLDEVRDLAATLRSDHERIDVLANNAGGIMGERQLTIDGNEKTLQVNHLAPFLLTNLLIDTLVSSRATVVNTSSIAARLFGHIDLTDLDLERHYTANKAYGDGKLANILFTRELDRRYGSASAASPGLRTAAFHPGVVSTSFAADSTSPLRFVYHTPLKHLVSITPDKGARTLVWLSTAPESAWESGAFYAKKKVSRTNPQADDAKLASDFWVESARRVGIDPNGSASA